MSDLTDRGPANRWLRLLITLLAPALLLLGERFALPIFRVASLSGNRFRFLAEGSDFDPAPFSLFSLGITPILSAFFVVEIGALIIPPWRRLRISGAKGRAKLWRATLILTLIGGLAQSIGIANSLQAGKLLADTSTAGIALIALLMLGLLLLLAMVALVSRHGLANGFSVLIAESVLSNLISDLSDGHPTLSTLAMPIAAISIAAAATFFVLRRAPLNHLRNVATASELTLWLPVCGTVALIWASAALELPATLFNLGLDTHGLGNQLYPRRAVYSIGLLIFVVAFAFLFGRLFNRRAAVAKVWSRFGNQEDPSVSESRVAKLLPAATVKSIAYLFVLAGLTLAIIRFTRSDLNVVSIPVLVAVLLDLQGEWKFRSAGEPLASAWPVHRVYAVDAARLTLQNAGISSYPRGASHRVLYQFFAPFVPIDLLVPAARAAEATALLQPLLYPLPVAAVPDEPISRQADRPM